CNALKTFLTHFSGLPWGKHPFLRFLRQKRAERVSAVRTMRRYGKSVWYGKLQNFYALKALRGQPGRLARH
ncbi:hypothetical protein ABN127_24485, partial [Escherichia coli]|uniref:hypothetical protein n=1 Tax=Escherichia coli TaxID=562 RepID=UPI0032DA910D